VLKVKTDNVTDTNMGMLIELLAAHHADGAQKKAPRTLHILVRYSKTEENDWPEFAARPLLPTAGSANPSAFRPRHLVIDCSEVDTELCAQHRRILEMAHAAWPSDELEVGLDK
jgi:hypothetical protein